ncbi:hypothetical protein BaRGS_00026295 [Batillaria attramentaria]|uniref:Uncharacterized protein n=1 Tax=Batillaria attramentaria TaxID=370345 RepID=A0ABD0K5W1_9CAEN
MTSVPHSHIPYGESGSGHYGNWLARQDAANIAIVKDQILKAVGDVFTIGDYGTADGSVSIPLIREIIELVRKTKGNVQIQVVYEDQPSNDFNSLFKRLHGLIPDPPTYLHEFKDVFVLASGASFYHQIVPDNSADLLMSFIAAHWMSEAPTKFQDSLHRFPNANEAERKLVAAQGAKDWEAFLLLRAKELKSGGVLIVSTPSEDPEMKQQGVRHCNQGTEEGMLNMWRRMRDEGKITNEEFVNTNFNRCTRYLEEYKAPFVDVNSAVYKAGMRLISAEQVLSGCVAQKAWQQKLEKEGVDDRKTWAKAVVQQHRCWSNSSFIRGLSDTRTESEKEALVDEMYSRLEAEVATQDPKVFKNWYLLGYVFARKE